MPIEGTINSLYLDYEQTKPLFPRTKTKAVSDENGVGLDATLSKIQNDLSNKVTETFVINKIAEAQLGGGSDEDIDLSGFATKDDISTLETELNTKVDIDGSSNMTGMLKFKPENGTSVITTETYRNLPTSSPTASYKTRNVIATSGAAMQFFKGEVGAEPSTEVNRLTLTETDTQLMKPLTLASGGTGIDLSGIPDGAVIRKAGKGTNNLYYTATTNGALYATSENGTPKFGTLPVAQGGTGATTTSDAITNLGINDYVIAQGKSGKWNYRKWNSGIAECWYYSWVTPTVVNSDFGVLNNAFKCDVILPFEFIDNNYSVTASVAHSNTSGVVVRVNHTSSNIIGITWAGNDESLSSGLDIHVVGYWK